MHWLVTSRHAFCMAGPLLARLLFKRGTVRATPCRTETTMPAFTT